MNQYAFQNAFGALPIRYLPLLTLCLTTHLMKFLLKTTSSIDCSVLVAGSPPTDFLGHLQHFPMAPQRTAPLYSQNHQIEPHLRARPLPHQSGRLPNENQGAHLLVAHSSVLQVVIRLLGWRSHRHYTQFQGFLSADFAST